MNNEEETDFDISKFLGINEIGMPTVDIKTTSNQLKAELNTEYLKGDFQIFGTNGSQEGLFLLPNYKIKDLWFPTSIKILPNPFNVVVQNREQEYYLEFRNEKIKITPNIL